MFYFTHKQSKDCSQTEILRYFREAFTWMNTSKSTLSEYKFRNKKSQPLENTKSSDQPCTKRKFKLQR